MNVFVTGGNGFIGSHLVRRMTGAGLEVRCLLRPNSRCERLRDLEFERVDGDVRDRDSLRRGTSGCDAAVHLAGPSSWTDLSSPDVPEVVVGGTANVLAAAADCGTRRVVYVSSAVTVNGSEEPIVHDEDSPWNPTLERLIYARAKRDAESLCRKAAERGTAVVIVNPTEVYGPNDTDLVTARNLVDFASSRPALVCRGGTNVVHVDDVVDGILAALRRGRPGERYILGGENLSIRQLCELTQCLVGRSPSMLELPKRPLRAAARAAELLGLPFPVPPAVIPYATRYWFMSSARAQRDLLVRFRPARETLQPTLSWLRASGHVAAWLTSTPGRREAIRGRRA